VADPLARPARWAAVVAFAGLAAGCGPPPTGTVTGTVKVGGQPVPNGLITFTSEVGNRDAFSAAVLDGRYTTGPIPAGPAKVSVIARGANPAEAAGGSDLAPPPKRAARKDVTVPPKYAATNTSGLTFDVAKGENTKDFDLAP
jgi:hypothetical protein